MSVTIENRQMRFRQQSPYSIPDVVPRSPKTEMLRVQHKNELGILSGLLCSYSASTIFTEMRVDSFKAITRKRCSSLLKRFRGNHNTILKEFINGRVQ
ncbi:unnamed protein product [Euphydryas editha]|uniref:Uncharacterized protein n=1 Tax=Euphydryas editha TaxID=104508 RepID=A0AAU9TGY5_EUPED|nr:unnamed protein product [Euphydryas editha]